MSNADSKLAVDYQCGQKQLSHRNNNYTLYVIMQCYTKKERIETKQSVQLKPDEQIHTSALHSVTSCETSAS